MFADRDEASDFKETAESFLSRIFDHLSRSISTSDLGSTLMQLSSRNYTWIKFWAPRQNKNKKKILSGGRYHYPRLFLKIIFKYSVHTLFKITDLKYEEIVQHEQN